MKNEEWIAEKWMRVYIFFLLHEKNIARQKLHAIEINNLVLLIFFYILKSTQFPFLKNKCGLRVFRLSKEINNTKLHLFFHHATFAWHNQQQ